MNDLTSNKAYKDKIATGDPRPVTPPLNAERTGGTSVPLSMNGSVNVTAPQVRLGPTPAAAEKATSGRSKAVKRPALDAEDAKLLHQVLVSGDGALAQRSDLGEMHKRIVKLFSTLTEGLGEMQRGKADADRRVLVERIDELEDAVNRMEGALRIEFEPLLQTALDDALSRQLKPKPKRARTAAVVLLALAAGIGCGAVFRDQMAPMAQSALRPVILAVGEIPLNSSRNGGSADSAESSQ